MHADDDPTWVGTGRYNGQGVLVCGGAGGLGFASATRMAAEGARVGIVDVSRDDAEAAAARIRNLGFSALGFGADVTNEVAVEEAFSLFERDTGTLDVMANFAGNDPRVPFTDMDLETWRAVTSVHLDGAFVTTHNAMRRMSDRGYGRILTVSSGTIYKGWSDFSAYITSKAGVLGLTRVLARHGGPHGVTANAIMPGLIETSRSAAVLGGERERVFASEVANQCVPRLGQPEDVAEAAAWICSRGASFLTGQAVYVSGGSGFIP